MPKTVFRFQGDTPYYLLLSNHIIEETAYEYETRYDDILLFMYVYILNKEVIQKEWYDFAKTERLMTSLNVEMPHSKHVISKLFDKLLERGLVRKMGDKFIVDQYDNKIYYSLKYKFANKVRWIHDQSVNPDDIKVRKKPIKRYKRRKAGRPKKGIIYSCRTSYKSKTNKLFK